MVRVNKLKKNNMATTQCKVTDLIKRNNRISYSFEVTPNISEDQLINNGEVEPLFYSITWHATIHKCENLEIAPLKLAKFLKNNNKNVLLHLSCNLLKKSFANDLLTMLQEEGIRNLFIILGESYRADTSDFKSTQELIRYIREKTGDYFCIGVAAFPDREDKFNHLMEKIVSGADFLITQAFFDVEIYAEFLNKCSKSGIVIPILPGIFPFETERELTGFLNLCKVHVTKQILDDVKTKSGNEIVGKEIQDLSKVLNLRHYHFFTLDKLERTSSLINTYLAKINVNEN